MFPQKLQFAHQQVAIKMKSSCKLTVRHIISAQQACQIGNEKPQQIEQKINLLECCSYYTCTSQCTFCSSCSSGAITGSFPKRCGYLSPSLYGKSGNWLQSYIYLENAFKTSQTNKQLGQSDTKIIPVLFLNSYNDYISETVC